jgi:hypothetical protein
MTTRIRFLGATDTVTGFPRRVARAHQPLAPSGVRDPRRAAADSFRRRLRDAFGWKTVVPDDGSTWILE